MKQINTEKKWKTISVRKSKLHKIKNNSFYKQIYSRQDNFFKKE